MLKKYVATQTFNIRKSAFFSKYLLVLHGVAIFAVCLTALELITKLSIVFLVLISLFFYLKQQLGFVDFSIRYSDARGWELVFPENGFSAIEILPSTVISRYLIVLHFKKTDNTKQALVICKDALKGGYYRKLMVELKINALKREDA